jgi:hypothetical protein
MVVQGLAWKERGERLELQQGLKEVLGRVPVLAADSLPSMVVGAVSANRYGWILI